MTFFDIFDRCKVSATCYTWKNHEIKTLTGDNIVFEKPNWNKTKIIRHYFSGTFTYCARVGCKYEKLDGSRVPWKVTEITIATGEEVAIEVDK